MAYNNRRGMFNMLAANCSSNVGMRRPKQPPQPTNFVRGGQLTPQNKPLVTMPIKQQPPQPQPMPNAPTFPIQPMQSTSPEILITPPVTCSQPPETVETKPVVDEQPKAETSMAPEDDPNSKKFWQAMKTKKIAKRERMRRRNMRLYKILTPKNAVMILNELVKVVNYDVKEDPHMSSEGKLYQATAIIDNNQYHGYGRSKALAKNCAAEAALKFLVKNKRFTLSDVKLEDSTEDEPMDVDGNDATLPWQHVASFALFKLFSSWGDDPLQITNMGVPEVPEVPVGKPENKPSKKMPENPEQMNPLMLLNHLRPNTKFEELGKSGNPPNCVFTFQCTLDDETFVGRGPNKKTAKKMAAYEACHKALGIQYPPEVFIPVANKNVNS